MRAGRMFNMMIAIFVMATAFITLSQGVKAEQIAYGDKGPMHYYSTHPDILFDKFYYYDFNKDHDFRGVYLGGFTKWFRTDDAYVPDSISANNGNVPNPGINGYYAHTPRALQFVCSGAGAVASIKSDNFKMTATELRVFRELAFMAKIENGWADAWIWIRSKTAAEQGLAFHIGGIGRQLLVVYPGEHGTSLRYYQADLWNAVKDYVLSHPDEWYEFYIEWYVHPYYNDQYAVLALDDFMIKTAWNIPEEPNARGVVIDIETKSDWTIVSFDGLYLCDYINGLRSYVAFVLEGNSAPGLWIDIGSNYVHIHKDSWDRTYVKLRIIGYVNVDSYFGHVIIQKGDIEWTRVKIAETWGYVHRWQIDVKNDQNIAGDPTNKVEFWYDWYEGQMVEIHKPWRDCEVWAYILTEDGYKEYVDMYYDEIGTRWIWCDAPVIQVELYYYYPYWSDTEYSAVGYRVMVMHDNTVHVLPFPKEWGPINAEDEGGYGFATVKSYSVYSYDRNHIPDWRWVGAPDDLEVMFGTEMAYIEEDMAGRVFTLFWGMPESYVGDILDSLDISENMARKEIAATAFWSVYLMHEVKGTYPDYVYYRCLDADINILMYLSRIADSMVNMNIPDLSEEQAKIIAEVLSSTWYWAYNANENDIYASVLLGVSLYTKYGAIYDAWNKVTEDKWIEMCNRLNSILYKDLGEGTEIPTTAHAIIGPVYAAHCTVESLANFLVELIEQLLFG